MWPKNGIESKALLVLSSLVVSCGGAGVEEAEEGFAVGGVLLGGALLGEAEEEAGAFRRAGVGDAGPAISSAIWFLLIIVQAWV